MKLWFCCFIAILNLTDMQLVGLAQPTNFIQSDRDLQIFHLLVETNNLQSDVEIRQLLEGTWEHVDSPGYYAHFDQAGTLYAVQRINGRFLTNFTGTWIITNGNILSKTITSNGISFTGQVVVRVGFVNDHECLWGKKGRDPSANEYHFLKRIAF